MKYLTSTKLSGFDQTSVYWKTVILLPVSLTSKALKFLDISGSIFPVEGFFIT